MATSPLVPGTTSGQNDRILGRGHGTGALGPSDSSDSGSDVQGFGADRKLGDAGLDSDSDRSGTGERLGATPDTEFEAAEDIAPDRIEPLPSDEDSEGDEPEAEEA
jgi:hypothetical protein